jgi:hypothetical protein
VRWLSGYRLGGRYDDMERIDDILTLLCNYERSRMAPSTPPCPKPHHIPNNIVTPDAIASRDPAARGAFYPRREFKVRWLSGYRLGGRYDDMGRIDDILTLLCNYERSRAAPSTPPCPKPHHIPNNTGIPDTTR